MGAVYRAKNVLTGRRVALKWILPTLHGADEMRARLLREARAMGRIEHPNVCAVYDVGEDGEAIYLVMELLSGRTLRAMMDERRLEVAEIAQILLSAMQGVSAAHRAGVVHRDIKPDNLFVCDADDGGRSLTKVLDFGVSKILDLTESDGLTKSGMAVGTPHYMSPEQIIGSKEVDERSDVYALGTILYQALARRLPFDGENYSALVVQIATGAPEPLEKHATPEGALLAPVVHKAIARQPSDRYADVIELARALGAAATAAGGEPRGGRRARDRSSARGDARWARRRPTGDGRHAPCARLRGGRRRGLGADRLGPRPHDLEPEHLAPHQLEPHDLGRRGGPCRGSGARDRRAHDARRAGARARAPQARGGSASASTRSARPGARGRDADGRRGPDAHAHRRRDRARAHHLHASGGRGP
jgi:serine/threonine-protein kinase